ncbi:MAG: TlpA family protein disulfide reductase, partial [Bacteroidetes bacterium]
VFEQKINEAPDSISYSQAIFNATEEWPNGLIRDELLNDMAAYIISPNEELETMYQFLINAVSDTSYHAKYTVLYQKMVLLQKGNPSPSFVDYENHAGGTSSLKDLLGKYVYIDVWATWCGPCIREIPALKEIEAAFHNKNIHFVSISVDRENDHETWIKMVKDKELNGIQLFADQAWESDFIRAYEINSIPRFILIDPSGKIIDADAARPSSPKLLELLNELKI